MINLQTTPYCNVSEDCLKFRLMTKTKDAKWLDKEWYVIEIQITVFHVTTKAKDSVINLSYVLN